MDERREAGLTRGFGLVQATALNVSNMVGVGPFITIPLIIASMGGPQCMLGWVLGAILAISDGLIWSELAAALPGTGGTYYYFREIFRGTRLGGTNEVTVALANDLPVALTVNAGAGEFDIDLHDVKVTDVRMNIGASSTMLVLPHPTGDLTVRADGGASSLVLEIPSDVEARITISGGLVSMSTTNPRTAKSGNVVETPGYATAKDRVTVTVTGGATSVAVR